MEERIKNLESRVAKLEENKSDVKTMVAVITEKLDNIVKSIDKLSLQYERNIAEINARYDTLEEKYNELRTEINEKTIGKDAEKWNKIITTIITAIATAIVGFLIGKS